VEIDLEKTTPQPIKMKHNFLSTLAVCITLNCIPKILNAQTLHDSLMAMDLNYYLNKPIDSFLTHLPQTYDSIKVASGNTITQGVQVVIFYTRNVDSSNFHIISVWPNTANHITVLNTQNLPSSQKWPLSLLKQENAGYIEIVGTNGGIKSAGDK